MHLTSYCALAAHPEVPASGDSADRADVDVDVALDGQDWNDDWKTLHATNVTAEASQRYVFSCDQCITACIGANSNFMQLDLSKHV